ncbi:hypothetical protein K438DRAFT_1929494 [Mycena galopus ATCC 62051]|nr:hypothetical protein K438DRAFT_1929494 [Mycena galopus ATCC 62051]
MSFHAEGTGLKACLRDGNASRKAGHDSGGLICSGETPCFRPQYPGSSRPRPQDFKTSRPQGFKTSRGLRSGSSPLRGAQGVPCRGGGGRARVLAPSKRWPPLRLIRGGRIAGRPGQLRWCGGQGFGCHRKASRLVAISMEYCEGWLRIVFLSRCTCLAAHASTADKNRIAQITTSRSERYNPF